jgi:hypothetical protein
MSTTPAKGTSGGQQGTGQSSKKNTSGTAVWLGLGLYSTLLFLHKHHPKGRIS